MWMGLYIIIVFGAHLKVQIKGILIVVTRLLVRRYPFWWIETRRGTFKETCPFRLCGTVRIVHFHIGETLALGDFSDFMVAAAWVHMSLYDIDHNVRAFVHGIGHYCGDA